MGENLPTETVVRISAIWLFTVYAGSVVLVRNKKERSAAVLWLRSERLAVSLRT